MRYNKVYATIIGIDNTIITVVTDSGITVRLDRNGYCGRKPESVIIGHRLKFYQRPQDRRPFVYKLTGE